jgi:hypothetical protein
MANAGINSDKIKVKYLKYGKLVSRQDERVPFGGEYSVTRRSTDLKPKQYDLLQPRHILQQRLETTLIEPKAERGVFTCRYHYSGGSDEYILMMRAHYRPEAGVGEGGRVFQQSEAWLVEWSDWIDYSKTIFDCARKNLLALPDFIDERVVDRLENAAPIIIDKKRNCTFDSSKFADLSEGSIAILDALREAGFGLPANKSANQSANRPADLVFGPQRQFSSGEASLFSSEEAFLSDVAAVFELLPPKWSSRLWIVSGFLGVIPAYLDITQRTCIRYLHDDQSRPPVDIDTTRKWLEKLIADARLDSRALNNAPPHVAAVPPKTPLAVMVGKAGAEGHPAPSRAPSVLPLARQTSRPAVGPLFYEDRQAVRAPQWPDALAEFTDTLRLAVRTRSKIEAIALVRCVREINDACGAEIRSRRPVILNTLSKRSRYALVGLSSLAATPSWSNEATVQELVEGINALSAGGEQIYPLLETGVKLLDGHLRDLPILIPDELESLTRSSLHEVFLAPKDPTQRTIAEQSAILAAWVARDGPASPRLNNTGYSRLMSALVQRYRAANWNFLDRDTNRSFIRTFIPKLFVHKSKNLNVDIDQSLELRVLNLMLDYIVHTGPDGKP